MVIAGGEAFPPVAKKTEIWTVGSDSFEEGPDLPVPITGGASMAQSLDGKRLVLSGGRTQSKPIHKGMYEMTCVDDDCTWRTLPSKLHKEMSYHASLFLPEESFDCGSDAK